MTYTKEELAWVAGFFDGEGCISIWKQKPTSYRGQSKNISHILKVSVSNTNESSIDYLVSLFGGYKSKRNANTKKNQKLVWAWECCANKAETFLRIVYPYLRIKKFRAEIAIQLRDNINKSKSKKYVPISLEDLNIRETISAKLKEENRRGLI